MTEPFHAQLHEPPQPSDRPALVFSHGFLMDSDLFEHQVAHFTARGFRCVTWDQRGFGRTGRVQPGSAFSFWDSAEDLRGVLDALGVTGAVVLVGMSQGASLSLRFALTHPDRVAGLVLMAARTGLLSDEAKAGNAQLLAAWLNEEAPLEPVARVVAGRILGAGPDAEQHWAPWLAKWTGAWERAAVTEAGETLMNRDDITERLAEIRAPALVIHGEADDHLPLACAEELAAALPGAGPVAQSPGGHACNWTHPEATNAAMEGFLGGLGGL